MHRYEASQLEMIQSLPLIEAIHSQPNEALQLCRNMKQRRRLRLPLTLPVQEVNTLKAWLNSSGMNVHVGGTPSILIAEAHGVKTSARDFAVDLIDLIVKSNLAALWVLPGEHSSNTAPVDKHSLSIETLLASLVTQALALNPTVLSKGPAPLSLKNFKPGLPIEHWFRLLQQSVSGLPFLLIVLDLPTIRSALRGSNDDQSMELDEFLGKILSISNTADGTIKIVALAWKLDEATAFLTLSGINPCDEESSFAEAPRIATDPGPRKVRMMRNPKFRAVYTARRQKLELALRDAAWSSGAGRNDEDGNGSERND
jgi:hypothetical protein